MPAKKKSNVQIKREVDAFLAKKPGEIENPMSWGPVTSADMPPVGGTAMHVDGSSYTIAPASCIDQDRP